MNNLWPGNLAVFVKMFCALVWMMTNIGCSSETQTITGRVIDESGAALSGAEVTACYSGWGWSSGLLVWDKNYCSKPVLTNNEGKYVINFSGADFIKLRAKKDGWIQTQDFNAKDSRIILIESQVHSSRKNAAAKLQEESFRKRLAGESDVAYYCRVIMPKARAVTVDYKKEALSIVPVLLKWDPQRVGLFAVSGSALAVNSLAREIVFRVEGQTLNGDFSLRSAERKCGQDISFIDFSNHNSHYEAAEGFEVFIPSIVAMFDMQTWDISAEP